MAQRESAADGSLEGYSLDVFPSPLLDESLRQSAHRCMCDVFAGDFETNGLGEDQLLHMQEPGAVYALARTSVQAVVACAMAAVDGSVGLVACVCTRPEHRCRGLARELMQRLLAELRGGPRWLVLCTTSPSAARICASQGFRGLNGSLGAADEKEWVMLRDAKSPEPGEATANQPLDLDSYILPGDVEVEKLGRRHCASAMLLLNAAPGGGKLRGLDLDDGTNAEVRLAQAVRDGEAVAVAVHTETRRIYGLAAGAEVYNLGPPRLAPALAGAAGEAAVFWERGYLVFPGLLAEAAPSLRSRLDEMLQRGAGAGTADWNAVSSGGAEFVLAVDGAGQPVPSRVMKVQAAALGSPVVLEALAAPPVCEKLRVLYGALEREAPEHVDVFGTKFFPMWPGGTSVRWHQDCHYFGTASPHVISVGVYLEDTDAENGCFRAIPGTHTLGAVAHKAGAGEWAQGEWAEPCEDKAVDIAVPAGSVVLFSAMLMHGAHKNTSSSRSRYSLFGHFVPASLGFAWRGTDFSHGVYKDRHEVY